MRVFVSYNNTDKDAIARFVDGLARIVPSFDSYFAPRSNTGGAYWLPGLSEELTRADAVLLFLGRSVGAWQELEYYEALRLSRAGGRPRIVPVILGMDSPGLPFLNQLHRLRSEGQDFGDLLLHLKAALVGADQQGASAPPWRETNPYRGLASMQTSDAAFFFGREAITGHILDLLRTRRDRVLTLVGNSGVGKSSIVNAGVLAALRSRIWPGDLDRAWPAELQDSPSWLPVTVVPGDRPLRALGLAFAGTWLRDPGDAEAQALKWEANLGNGSPLIALAEVARRELAERTQSAPPARVLLYIDQGEELYARSERGQAARFSSLIAEAVAHPGLSIVASLRADFYGRLQDDAPLFAASDRIDVPPLARDAVQLVIRKPAALLGARFEPPEMVSVIADATAAETGALPLLSYMMAEAWEMMRRDDAADGTLRFSPGLVDVSRPLTERAERFLVEHPGQETVLRRLFTLRLAHVPKDGEPVRRRATQAECEPEEWALAQSLAGEDWRLLTASDPSGVATIEVAHEALLRRWPRLTGWLDEAREFLIWKGQTEAARQEWEAARGDQKDQALLMGLALANARRWVTDRRNDVPPAELSFIDASIAADDRERAEQEQKDRALASERERSQKRRRWLTWITSLAALIVAILAVFVVRQNVSLKNQLFETVVEQARLRSNAAAELLGRSESDFALAVAAAAFPVSHRERWSEIDRRTVASQNVAHALVRSSLRLTLRGHEGPVTSGSFSPDGRWIVTASDDRTARLWEAASGAELRALRGHEGTVTSASFSPDGRWIVTASVDRTARLWEAASGAGLRVLRGHVRSVTSASFSPDGRWIVTASADGTAQLWEAASGAALSILRGHERAVTSASFSPDGRWIVTASDDGTARLWEAASGAELRVLRGHESELTSASFSPDGRWIVTASAGDTARLWEAASGAELRVLRGHEGTVTSASFSPDGRWIVTASDDGTARLWEAASGAELRVLRGHESELTSASFSPDGRWIVTASRDGTARLREAASGAELRVLRGHNIGVLSASFSHDGRWIVTASRDGTARLWEAASGAELRVLRRHWWPIASASFSPDGRLIVTASVDRTARLSEAASGAELRVLRGHEREVTGASFSPDGRWIVTGSLDRTARLWEAASGAELRVLRGHNIGVLSASFSPDGQWIVTASRDGTARLWEAASGAELRVLRGHESELTGASFSPDGRWIVTASDDRTARLWEAASGAELRALRGHEGTVTSASFSPDGRWIVTASVDRTALVWKHESLSAFLDAVHQRVSRARALSDEQECRYFVRSEGC
jgi:WD40 repeat protein